MSSSSHGFIYAGKKMCFEEPKSFTLIYAYIAKFTIESEKVELISVEFVYIDKMSHSAI